MAEALFSPSPKQKPATLRHPSPRCPRFSTSHRRKRTPGLPVVWPAHALRRCQGVSSTPPNPGWCTTRRIVARVFSLWVRPISRHQTRSVRWMRFRSFSKHWLPHGTKSIPKPYWLPKISPSPFRHPSTPLRSNSRWRPRGKRVFPTPRFSSRNPKRPFMLGWKMMAPLRRLWLLGTKSPMCLWSMWEAARPI